MSEAYLLAQAAYCRRMAEKTRDMRSRRTLLALAGEYQHQVAQRRKASDRPPEADDPLAFRSLDRPKLDGVST
jgi:hypothetical protein